VRGKKERKKQRERNDEANSAHVAPCMLRLPPLSAAAVHLPQRTPMRDRQKEKNYIILVYPNVALGNTILGRNMTATQYANRMTLCMQNSPKYSVTETSVT
jgi:hypothetical protein